MYSSRSLTIDEYIIYFSSQTYSQMQRGYMDAILTFVNQHIFFGYFLRGLAFFILSLGIFFQLDKAREYKFGQSLWLMATFALILSACRWSMMFGIIMPYSFFGSTNGQLIDLLLLAFAFAFLLIFGIKLFLLKINKYSFATTIFIGIYLLIVFIMINLALYFAQNTTSLYVIVEKIIRLFIVLPSALICGLEIIAWRNHPEIKQIRSKKLNINFIIVGASFIIFAIFSIFVPENIEFSKYISGQGKFNTYFTFLVLSSVCASSILIFMTSILKMFDFRQKEAISKLFIFEQSARKNLEEQVNQATLELKKSTQMLIDMERNAVVGTFAAGIAHELNNPLMGILNYVHYCIKHTDVNNETYKILQDTEHETFRCIKIVKNLLTFARHDIEEKEKFKFEALGAIFERVLSLLNYRITNENIIITINLSATIKTRMQIDKIQQVFLNLLTNAIDAASTSTNKNIVINEKVVNNKIIVTITDNGCGIKPEYKQKIFTPFFTTKSPGKGTGLGLSISKKIIEDHNGELTFESDEKNGTTFTIVLPITMENEQ